MTALLQHHFKHINISELSLQQQIELFAQLKWVREKEAALNPLSAL